MFGLSWLRQLGEEATSLFRRLFEEGLAEGPRAAEPLAGDDPQRYFHPAALAKIGHSPLLARVVVEGFLNGLHQSPFHGFSVEFAEHREYVPGDDPRYVDWALYARTDHHYIKRFEEETNLRCYLLLDASASMGFGTGATTKWDYACFLASCLAYLMVRQQDAVGLSLVGNKPGFFVPPRCRRTHLRQLMATMIRSQPAGTTNLAAALRGVVRKMQRRGLVVLISDLVDDPQETLKAIKLLAGHRHEVLVFHIQDETELEFSFTSPALFTDLETGEELEVDPQTARARYMEEAAAHREFFRRGLARLGIDYQLVDTRQSYDRALSAYLDRRTRSRR